MVDGWIHTMQVLHTIIQQPITSVENWTRTAARSPQYKNVFYLKAVIVHAFARTLTATCRLPTKPVWTGKFALTTWTIFTVKATRSRHRGWCRRRRRRQQTNQTTSAVRILGQMACLVTVYSTVFSTNWMAPLYVITTYRRSLFECLLSS